MQVLSRTGDQGSQHKFLVMPPRPQRLAPGFQLVLSKMEVAVQSHMNEYRVPPLAIETLESV